MVREKQDEYRYVLIARTRGSALPMLCEGAFPLMETDEMNYEILQNVSQALKFKAKLIFTTLNGLFPLCNSIN
ncbi:MAG: class I SAM-dependent methyltransferase, partial [Spirochaetia bacterium]